MTHDSTLAEVRKALKAFDAAPIVLGIPDAVSWLRERQGDFKSPDFDKVLLAAMNFYWVVHRHRSTIREALAKLDALIESQNDAQQRGDE